MTACSNKCGGKCCQAFILPLSPMELKHWDKVAEKTGKNRYQDIRKIADMVIFLGHYGSRTIRKLKGKRYHYTCKWLNKESGLCTNYENRPSMCSDFPYGNVCEYKGCNFKGGGLQ